MMGLFMTGVTSLVESSAVGALLAALVAALRGQADLEGARGFHPQHAVDQLHVPVDHPGGALLQLRL